MDNKQSSAGLLHLQNSVVPVRLQRERVLVVVNCGDDRPSQEQVEMECHDIKYFSSGVYFKEHF